MAKRRMVKMTLPPRPLRASIVVATPEMIKADCAAVLFITREAAAELGLRSGEDRGLFLLQATRTVGLRVDLGRD